MKVRRLVIPTETRQGISSRLSVEPRGMQTAALEALTSWFCRTAEHHWMLTIPLWNAVNGEANVGVRHRDSTKRRLLQSINGHGRLAKLAADRFRSAFGGFPEYLTTLAWGPVFDPMAHGLLKRTLSWCPLCWKEDRECGETPYVRLLWTLKPVSVCPKHKVELRVICYKCRNAQDVLPRIPRQYVCRFCGTDLAESIDHRRLRLVNPDAKILWIARASGALIARTCATGTQIPPDAFQDVLLSLARQHFNGSVDDLADACGFSRRMVRDWAAGRTKPYLTVLLEFAYRVQVPPDVMLLDGPGLTDPKDWLRLDRPVFVRRFKKHSQSRIEEMRRELCTAIRAGSDGPSSLQKFAKQLGTTYAVLQYHFPKESKLLQVRARARKVRRITAESKARIKKTEAAARSLASKGIYPSQRALKAYHNICPSHFRRREIADALTRIRRDFLVGAYATKERGNRRHAVNQ